ncbi:MAG: hypothetical protein VX830_11510 [Candidatus Poribacteria bacterium]|nr:hypothetical protein [Candidatus Poribacteria bacterium]
MPLIFRFTIAGLLLVLAIFSILLWKRSLITIDLREGGMIVATAYDFEPIIGQFKTDGHVSVLSEKSINKLVEKSNSSDLVGQLRLMPESVQSRFLPHLSDLNKKQINSILKSNQGLNQIWIKLISLRKKSSKLKQGLIDDAAEIYREENSQTRDSAEISKILPGLNIDGIDIERGVPDIYQILFSINVDKIQSDMDQENKLEREIEQKESLIVKLQSECSSLEDKNKELENTNGQLKRTLKNLKEFSLPDGPLTP